MKTSTYTDENNWCQNVLLSLIIQSLSQQEIYCST